MIPLPWRPALPLTTERLVLRVHESGDVDDMLVFHSDPEVVRYLPWPVRDRALVEEALAKRLSQGTVEREGDWLVLAMELRETGQVIGEVLLKVDSVEEHRAELGYAMNAEFHGRGLAREAAEAILSLGIHELRLDRVIAHLDARNPASARLLERLGFTLTRSYEEEFTGELAPGLEYGLDVART